MRLGPSQKRVLVALLDGNRSAREVSGRYTQLTYDMAHSSLRRLEDQLLVRRVNVGQHTEWELTHEGRRWAETITSP